MLVLNAETTFLLVGMLHALSSHGSSLPLVAAHAGLASALDSLLEDETIVQVKAMQAHFGLARWQPPVGAGASAASPAMKDQWDRRSSAAFSSGCFRGDSPTEVFTADLRVIALEVVVAVAPRLHSSSVDRAADARTGPMGLLLGPRCNLLRTIDLLLRDPSLAGGPAAPHGVPLGTSEGAAHATSLSHSSSAHLSERAAGPGGISSSLSPLGDPLGYYILGSTASEVLS